MLCKVTLGALKGASKLNVLLLMDNIAFAGYVMDNIEGADYVMDNIVDADYVMDIIEGAD